MQITWFEWDNLNIQSSLKETMEEEKWVFWPAQSKWLVLWFVLGLCLTRHIKNHLPFNQLAFPLPHQVHYPGAYVQVGRQFPVRGFPMCSQSIFNSNAWLNSFSEAGSSYCENSHASNSCFDWFRFICCNFLFLVSLSAIIFSLVCSFS